jgi:ketosteroid isomerase-like protein
MYRRIALTFFLTAIAASLSVDAHATSSNSLAQVSADWSRDWQAKNLEAVLSLYAEDAVFMDADGSRVAGKPALRKFFESVLKQYSAQPSLHSVDNSSSGDLGYDWGDYSEVVTPVATPDRAIRTSGTYLVILKKVAGHWLIAEQMWTGNVPVPVKR